MLNQTNCPICNSTHRQISYKKVNEFTSFLCKNCNHIYVRDAKLDDINFSELYTEDFYEKYMGGIGYRDAFEQTLKHDFQKKINFLKSLLPDGAKVLEVGAGPGFFAKLLSDEGYQVTAVELTPGAKEYAEKTSGFTNIISEDLADPECSLYNEKFDCVISWAVIEHVNDVNSFVALLKRYTKKNGYVCVDTGILTRFLTIVDRGYTSWLYPPYHLHVFSDRSIKRLFAFNRLHIFYFKPHFNFSVVRSVIILRYIKEFVKAILNYRSVINKSQPGQVAIVGLIVGKNTE